ncbi:hypothetical protein GGX14DRAFT_544083 [Mycena pura]|uniref:Uncharacterized protein n=1 Tax=Mycena pura TaxID=153505 RepID=A0AAD6YE24_9AGAR|nr:hypothetical protein GGX14DRAFT_544083 [Mycena pura]
MVHVQADEDRTRCSWQLLSEIFWRYEDYVDAGSEEDGTALAETATRGQRRRQLPASRTANLKLPSSGTLEARREALANLLQYFRDNNNIFWGMPRLSPHLVRAALPRQPDDPSTVLPRRAPSDVFRPRLPLDPFSPQTLSSQPPAPAPNPDAPWRVRDLSALTHAVALSPNVLLVLGAPNPHALAPLLRSPTFARSLVLLVTHTPPTRAALAAAAAAAPSTSPPAHAAIRVLRLAAPLVPAAPTFALALVAVLEAAGAVARAWRAQVAAASDPLSAVPDIAQLAQAPDGSFSVPEPLAGAPDAPALSTPPPSVWAAGEHAHPPVSRRPGLTPTASVSSHANGPYQAGRTRPPSALSLASTVSASASASGHRASGFFSSSLSLNKRDPTTATPKSSKRMSSSSSSKRNSTSAQKNVSDGTRAFDALVSFLPPAQLEKAVLKHVVLVSTLAGGSLAGPAFGCAHAGGGGHPRARDSYFVSAPASRRGSVSSGSAPGLAAEWDSAPSLPAYASASAPSSTGTSRAPSFIGDAGSGTERPASPARSFLSFLGSNFSESRSVSASSSPRGSVYEYNYGGDSAHAPARRGQGTRAHIVHVLPASYRSAKLTSALGAFTGSYSPSSSSARKPHAYVLAERALGSLESVLVGALDGGEAGAGGARGASNCNWVAGVIVPREQVEQENGEGSGSGEGDGSGEDDCPEGALRVETDIATRRDEGEGRGSPSKSKNEMYPHGLPTPPASRSGSGEGEDEGLSAGQPLAEALAPAQRQRLARSPSGSRAYARTPHASAHGHERVPSTSTDNAHTHTLPPGAAPPVARIPSSSSSTHEHGARAPTTARTPATSLPSGGAPPVWLRRRSTRGSRTFDAPAAAPVYLQQNGAQAEAAEGGSASGRRRFDSAPPPPPLADASEQRPRRKTWGRKSRLFGGKGAGADGLLAPPPASLQLRGRSSPDLRELSGGAGGGGGGGGAREKHGHGLAAGKAKETEGRPRRWWAFWA